MRWLFMFIDGPYKNMLSDRGDLLDPHIDSLLPFDSLPFLSGQF
ncbi:hypothetical protein PALA111701_15005 [Paenibacillus lactis]